MLSGFARHAFEAETGKSGHRRSFGVSNRAEDVHMLLHSLTTNSEIQNALAFLRNIHQKKGESETDYCTGLRAAMKNGGMNHSDYADCTFFIDGMPPSIRPLMPQVREDNPYDLPGCSQSSSLSR